MSNYILYYTDTGEIFTSRNMHILAKKMYEKNHPRLSFMDGLIQPDELNKYKVDITQDPPVLVEKELVIDKWQPIRYKRDILLLHSDWTHGQDSPLSESKRAEWAAYRQALRDITAQPDPDNVVWPTAP